MSHTPPSHLSDKYRLYAISFEQDYVNRANQNMILVHVARPVSLQTLCGSYIFQHAELTIEKTGEKIQTSRVCGIQKIDNGNKPKYELTQDGILREI